MSNLQSTPASQDIKTVLGPETVFRGVLRFGESLKILGRCEGRIESRGTLIIGKGAEIVAEIKVGAIIIGGSVKGNIEATSQTEMLSTGKVFGNIRTAELKIEDGVVFEGKVEMLKNPDSLDIFSATATQLKQSLETL
jgi:cytoskeletal protein CcmA (bactofilin family)